MHEEIFNCLREKNFPLIKRIYIQDFEQASIKAIKSTYGEMADIHGCYFQFLQNVVKKVRELGEIHNYNTNASFNRKIKMFMALCLLPPNDIPNAFKALEKTSNALPELTEYLKQYYVVGKNGKDPLYPPTIWSSNYSILNGLPRTQNINESWNSKFNRIISGSHVGVYKLITELKMEAHASEIRILKLNLKPKLDPYNKIKKILEKKDLFKTTEDFLEQLSTTIGK